MQVLPDLVLVCLPLYPEHFTPLHFSGPNDGVGSTVGCGGGSTGLIGSIVATGTHLVLGAHASHLFFGSVV